MSIAMRHRLLVSTLLASAAYAVPAVAQDTAVPSSTQAPSTAPNQTTTGQPGLGSGESEPSQVPNSTGDIVVTGTLIRNPNLTSSAPVSVIGQDEVQLRQTNTAEEVLRTLPGAVPSIGSAVNNGNGGQSLVNLRGLGSNRNIVLLDGNRLVPGNLDGTVDLNNIPLSLIERVDALTGGASTTYGADAVAGVVNFITRKDFTGIDLSASEQITGKGDGNYFRTDLTLGASTDDGRGNAVFSIGYQESDPVYQGGRSFSERNIDSFSGAASGSGTSVPATFSGTRPLVNGVPSTNPAVLNGGNRQINAAGAAVAAYAPFNFNPFNIFQTPFKRFNLFGQANYKISDGVEFYTRGLFSRNTVSTIVAPSGVFASPVEIPLSNPYLPTTLRSQFCAFDVNPNPAVYTPRFTPAQCAAGAAATSPTAAGFGIVGRTGGFVSADINNDGVIGANEGYDPNPAVTLARRGVETGPRVSDFQTTIFDYRAGLRGDITPSISYDVAGSYGESTNRQTLQGYVLTSRARSAIFATNTATCLTGATGGASITAATGCIPVNFFGGANTIAPNQIPYLLSASTSTVETSLGQVRGIVNGELGITSPFATSAVNFAAGAEYRRYRASQASDTLAQTPGELGGAGGAQPTFNGGYEVTEGFGELVVPLVADVTLIRSLQLEGGIRRSHYKVFTDGSPTFNTTTWKAGGSWTPVDALKLRGVYQRAVRAPNIGELFTPVTTVLTNLSADPCAGAAPVSNADLRAVCLAQGAPAGTIGSIPQPNAGQANITTGGNPNLRPEIARSYTLGAVIQAPFITNLTITADYYNIKVRRAVSSFAPGDILTQCFGNVTAASANDPACLSIRRNPASGDLSGDPATTPGLLANLSNLGLLQTDGIDATLAYRQDLGFGRFNLSAQGNWTSRSKFQAAPGLINRECTGYYSINCGSIQPEFQWNVRGTMTVDPVDFSVLWRHIDSVRQEPIDADPDNSGPAYSGPVATLGGGNYNFGRIPAFNYIDFAARVAVNEHFEFTFTVQNAFDKKPPIVGSTVGTTTYNSGNTFPSTYDALGRRFAAGARLRF